MMTALGKIPNNAEFEEIARAHAKNGMIPGDRFVDYESYGFAIIQAAGKRGAGAAGNKKDRELGLYLKRKNISGIKIKGKLYHPKEKVFGDKRLRPFLIADLSDEEMEILRFRMSHEAPINAMFRPTNLAVVVVETVGPDNPFVRRLEWWVNGEHGGIAPIREEQEDVSVAKDSAASHRFQALLNAALWYYMTDQELGHVSVVKMALQLFDWIFLDPLEHTAKLKSWMSLMTQSAFCLSTKGTFTAYGKAGPSPQFFNAAEITIKRLDESMTNQGYYDVVRESYETMLQEMVDENLIPFKNYAVSILDMHFSAKNLQTLGYFSSFVGYLGYTGTDLKQTFVDRFDPDLRDADRPMDKHLSQEFQELLESSLKNRRFPEQDTFRTAIPGILTSKSAGVEGASFTVKGTNGLGPRGEDDLKISGKSKALVGMVRPSTMHIDQVADYTEESPGTLGSRRVVGSKDERSIFALRISNFVWEFILQETMYREMSKHESKPEPGLGNASYSFNSATGIADHIDAIIASTDEYSLELDMDYSEFDTTFTHFKRLILMKVWKRVFSEFHRADESYGTQDLGSVKLGEYLERIWDGRKRRNAAFEFRYVSESLQLRVDQLLSGEYVTSLLGSFVNRCAFLSVLDRIESQVHPIFRQAVFEYARFMGDDTKSVFSMSDPRVERVLNPLLVELVVKIADDNQMKVNPVKTMSRTLAGDYLRNRVYCGVFLPGAITQTLGSEKGRQTDDIHELMSGWMSIVQLNVQRGWNIQKASRFVKVVWTLIRSVRTFNTRERVRYYMPFDLLYTPRAMGGIGFVDDGFLGASKDAYTYQLMASDPHFKERILRASGIIGDASNQAATTLLRAIGANRVYPENTFDEGRKWVHRTLNQAILKQMPLIRAEMQRRGLPPSTELAYDRIDIALIEKAVKGARNYTTTATRDYAIRVTKAYERVKDNTIRRVDVPNDVKVMSKISFRLGPLLKPWFDGRILPTNPFSALRHPLNMVCVYYGLNMGENGVFRLEDDLTKSLRQSNTIRRDIPAETIISVLSHPKYFGNIENISLFFRFIGADEAEAVNIATNYVNTVKSYTIFKSMKGTSFNDAILPMIDFSPHNVERIVSLAMPTPEMIKRVINTYGMCISLNHFCVTGEARQIIVDLKDNVINELYAEFLSAKNFLDVMPNTFLPVSNSIIRGEY